MAMPVFDVKGECIPDVPNNENLTTQGLIWSNASRIQLTNVKTCLEIMELREKYLDNPAGLCLST